MSTTETPKQLAVELLDVLNPNGANVCAVALSAEAVELAPYRRL